MTVKNIGQERYARNPRIARVLSDLSYVRELNEGVPRIFDAMREFMLTEPEYRDSENTVTLILRNKVTEHKETIYGETLERIEGLWSELNKTQRSIIQLLFEQQELNVAQLSTQLELTPRAIRYNLRNLIELNILEKDSDKARDPEALFHFLNE